MGAASVRYVPADIKREVFYGMVTRAGDEKILPGEDAPLVPQPDRPGAPRTDTPMTPTTDETKK